MFDRATGSPCRPSPRSLPPPNIRIARSRFPKTLPPLTDPTTEFRVIDPPATENLRSLKPGDHDAFLREIAGICLADAPLRITGLAESLAAGDLSKITRAAHRIKGSSANLGAMALRAVAERLEHHARTDGITAGALFVTAIESGFARAQTALTKRIARQAGRRAGPPQRYSAVVGA